MAINTTGLTPGEYNLVLESFDSAFEALALKTDSIKIIVVKPKGYSDTLAYFITILEQKSIISGKSEKWILPDIEKNWQVLQEIHVEPDSLIAPYISFDSSSNKLFYNGGRI